MLYGTEWLDEFIYGLQGAVLPDLRADLALTYTEVGLLLTVPGLVGLVVEPAFGLLGDTRHRKALVVGGTVATAAALALVGLGHTFASMLLAFTVLYVASGVYVNLSQATLIDRDPARAEQTMARWGLVGSAAVATAPLVVTALFYFGYGWRGLYLGLAGAAGVFAGLVLRRRFDAHAGAEREASAQHLWRELLQALQNRELLRWLILMELGDLMLDRLLEVTGLYLHDVAGLSLAEASAGVAVLTLAGLVGNALVVPVLEKWNGVWVVRTTALFVLVLYAGWLLIPVVWLKFVLIAFIGLGTSGWFAVLQGRCYAVLPGRSGLVVAVTALGSVATLFVPVLVGRVADLFGLQWAMWLLILGPLALWVGLPRESAAPRANLHEQNDPT